MPTTQLNTNPGAAGDLQGRIAAVAELLASYRSDHIEGLSQLALLLADLRLLADAQGLDFFCALDASYVAYLTAKTPH
jgi:hypothetical protein